MFKKLNQNFIVNQTKYILAVILLLTALLRLNMIWYPTGYVFDEVYHAFTAKEFLLNHQVAWEWWNTPPTGVAYEWTHPPLAKEFMALSMWVFHTQDAWAYRLPGVIFGIISVYLVFLVTKKIFESIKSAAHFGENAALLAAFAFSLDGLNFVQSRTGMNDVYFVAFMLATVLFFLKKKYFTSAVFLGLALTSKWTGLYLIGLIFSLLFINFYKERIIRYPLLLLAAFGAVIFGLARLLAAGPFEFWGINNENLVNFFISGWTHAVAIGLIGIYLLAFPKFRKMGWYLFVPPLIYLATYLPFFFYNHYHTPFKSIFDQFGYNYNLLMQLQQQMWWYHSNLKATHDYASQWWSWPFNLFPVWYYVDYHKDSTISNIFASGNPLMFLLGFFSIAAAVWETGKKWLTITNVITIIIIFANFLYMGYFLNTPGKMLVNYQTVFSIAYLFFGITVAIAAIILFYQKKSLYIPLLGYLFFWLPWALSPRIMFLYHYSPAVPFMAMILGYKLQILAKEKTDRYLLYLAIIAILIGFFFVYPVLIGLPLSKDHLEFFFRSNLTKNPFG